MNYLGDQVFYHNLGKICFLQHGFMALSYRYMLICKPTISFTQEKLDSPTKNTNLKSWCMQILT